MEDQKVCVELNKLPKWAREIIVENYDLDPIPVTGTIKASYEQGTPCAWLWTTTGHKFSVSMLK